jgi:hypothetical protein
MGKTAPQRVGAIGRPLYSGAALWSDMRLLCAAAVVAASPCMAFAETGKLLLTGGVSSVDSAAGGGISPWAVIGTNATDGQLGYSAHLSTLGLTDYRLTTYGTAIAIDNRFEVSASQQDLDASPATGFNALGFSVASGQHIVMNTLGLKVRLMGNAVLDADTWLPQVSLGVMQKETASGTIEPVLRFVGAKTNGTEAYVAATKLFLAQGLLVNATLRYTNANQGGLLGFGSAAPGQNNATWVPEFSVAYLLSRDLAVGAEFRTMPNNLEALGRSAGLGDGLNANHWSDIFVAWAPSKHYSITAAYVDLGQVVPAITNGRNQAGVYASIQFTL